MRREAPHRKRNFPRASRPLGSILASNSPGNVKIAGIKLTHPDRTLYPDQGITKLDLAHYYEQVDDWMIPHVEKRPLTLVRCPEGHERDEVKAFAKKVAQSLALEAPRLYTATMSKAKRKGKIFIDYLRNARTATAVCAYSTRACAGAPVSVPVSWQELATDVRAGHFTIRNVPQRLARLRKDPWDGYEAARATITAGMRGKLWEMNS